MEHAAAASHAAAAAQPLAADPNHLHYPHPYAYSYPYAAYHQAAAADPSAAASSSYYYPNPTAAAASAPAAAAPSYYYPDSTAAPYDPYAAAYHYYAPPPAAGAGTAGGAAGGGHVGYYFSAGEAQQGAPAPTAAAGKEAGKSFGFDAQRYAQAAASRVSNGMAPPVAAPGMHHAQWNAHFGHPMPKNVLRKNFVKKGPKVVQPATCEVCKIQCDTLDVLMIHKTGKKHKKNLEKLQDSITPKPVKPQNIAVRANMAPAAVSTSMAPAAVSTTMGPAVQTKKKKSSAATPEDLEVKKRRVLEAGAAQGEVKICMVCNVVVNSQKVYDFHITGQKHKAMVEKQQGKLQML